MVCRNDDRQLTAVEKQEIEDVERDFGSGPAVETGLKRCEARPVVIVEHDGLAV
jgi:hypothetical protein